MKSFLLWTAGLTLAALAMTGVYSAAVNFAIAQILAVVRR